MQLLIRLRRKEREGREVIQFWTKQIFDSPISESQSNCNAVGLPYKAVIANTFCLAFLASFAVN